MPENGESHVDGPLSGSLPGIIVECQRSIEDGFDRRELIDAVRKGDLGNVSDWESFDERLKSEPVSRDDILCWARDGLPFDRSGAKIGASPEAFSIRRVNADSIASTVSALYELRGATDNARFRKTIARWTQIFLGILGEQGGTWTDVGVAEVLNLARDRGWISLGVLAALPEQIWSDCEGTKLIDEIGRGWVYGFQNAEVLNQLGSKIESQLRRDIDRAGLLRILAKLCASGYRPTDPALNAEPDLFAESRYKAAALLVRLAQGRLWETEMSDLVALLVELAPSNAETVDDTVSILQYQELSVAIASNLLPTLFAALLDSDWRSRQRILDGMLEFQRRRLSSLADMGR